MRRETDSRCRQVAVGAFRAAIRHALPCTGMLTCFLSRSEPLCGKRASRLRIVFTLCNASNPFSPLQCNPLIRQGVFLFRNGKGFRVETLFAGTQAREEEGFRGALFRSRNAPNSRVSARFLRQRVFAAVSRRHRGSARSAQWAAQPVIRRVLALMRKRRNLDRPPAHDRGLRRAGFASSASRAR